MSHSFSISVPIGAYHPLLRDCLQSLAIQQPRPAVALLDASKDQRVQEIADEFDDLIVYRRHGPDGGQSDAILEGWANAPGNILGWLNADDALYPGALQVASQRFSENKGVNVVYGHSIIINDDDDITGYHWAVEPPSERLLTGDIISQPSCFFAREFYESVGGLNENLHYTMDWDLWVRFWRAGAKFSFIDETMSRVLWTKEAKTGGFSKARRKELDRIIGQNASITRQMKSKAGFALHHVFEYMMPDQLAHSLRRRLRSSGDSINGLGRNGEIAASATLPIVHYSNRPISAISFNFARADSILINAGGSQKRLENHQGMFSMSLPSPLEAGTVLPLMFENESERPALLLKTRLV